MRFQGLVRLRSSSATTTSRQRPLAAQGYFLVSSVWTASSGFAICCRAMSVKSSAQMEQLSNRIAVGQMRTTNNKLENLRQAAMCAGMARRQGATMLFLPECFGFLGESSAETIEMAEPIVVDSSEDNASSQKQPFCNVKSVNEMIETVIVNSMQGEDLSTTAAVEKFQGNKDSPVSLLDGIQTIARQSNLWISATMHQSGAPLSIDNLQRVYNTHIIIDNNGELKTTYSKIHLFDVSIPGKVELKESKTTAPGHQVVVCDSPVGKLGLSVCYDVRFPELYVKLVQQGAQILLVPSAFTVPTGTAHWHILLRARAIESQCYVIAAAQFGQHNKKRESYGHSLVVDPWGVIVADAGGVDGKGTTVAFAAAQQQQEEEKGTTTTLPEPTVITCDIDLDLVNSIRQRIPVQQHRESADY